MFLKGFLDFFFLIRILNLNYEIQIHNAEQSYLIYESNSMDLDHEVLYQCPNY